MTKQPLVLALCQVRFSTLRSMEKYIPAIQEQFRRHDFPIERAGKIQTLMITPSGMEAVTQDRWEYRTKDEEWSIQIFQDCVSLQTTKYKDFESFAARLEHAVGTVLRTTEQDQFGVVQRIGLRYVNGVIPRAGESHRFYLRPGFHGVTDTVFLPGTNRLHVESVGRTEVGGCDVDGTMIVRAVQNDQGIELPPDLLAHAPNFVRKAKAGDVVTLVDMDHFIEGNFEPKTDWIMARAYELHDRLVETFHEHVATPEAVEVWK